MWKLRPRRKRTALWQKRIGRKRNTLVCFPGPTAADIQATVVQERAPDVEAYLGRDLGGALQDDVMEVFSPPRILEHTATLGLRRGFVS